MAASIELRGKVKFGFQEAGELKVLEGTHRTEPMGLLGGEVGLEIHTKPKIWTSVVLFPGLQMFIGVDF